MSIQQMLLGGSGVTGYNLERSLRFRASASAYLNRTLTTPTNNKIWTWSGWIKRGTLGGPQNIFGSDQNGPTDYAFLFFNANGTLSFYDENVGGVSCNMNTTQVFLDPSAWYHIMFAVDTTQATASNRFKLYVNGSQVTAFLTASYYSLNATTMLNASGKLGRFGTIQISGSFARFYDGYLAETYFIDGQALTPASFGDTNALTGVWQPAQYTGTYGTNGFYLKFTDNSTAAALGTDFSGNSNTWTVNNISVTAGVTYDSMTDVPTLTSATVANYCTLNPISKDPAAVLSDANLTFNNGSNLAIGTMFATSGKIYCEALWSGYIPATGVGFGVIGAQYPVPTNGFPSIGTNFWRFYNGGGATMVAYNENAAGYSIGGGAIPSYSNSPIRMCLDVDTGYFWYGNGTSWFDSAGGTTGDPSAGTNPTMTISSPLTRGGFTWAFFTYSGGTFQANFGQRPFAYTPPTGFVALNTFNLPTSTIVKGNTVMDATLYTGNASTQTVTNAAGFQPDLVWLKSRNQAYQHGLFDSVRGSTKGLVSNSTAAEVTFNSLTSFNSNGFSLNTDYNDPLGVGANYVAWQWQAGQGTTSTNTSGTITSTVSVNATAGFSVVTYTGTNVNATVGHGLGVAPSFIIFKARNVAIDWLAYHKSVGATAGLYLNKVDSAFTSSGFFNNTAPTSSVFTIGVSNFNNGNTYTNVAYCFAPIAGYSAFGSYTGNGSDNGPFVYLGFIPKYVLIKKTDSNDNWILHDTTRNPYNTMTGDLYPNLSSLEDQSWFVDSLSNGFKVRSGGSTAMNTNGGNYIYACFAENPFKYSLAR